jgi:hypothetical protein
MKKRIFRKDNRKNVKYTFHSYGTHIEFNPYDIITDDRILNEANMFESMTRLDLYRAEVKMANAKHVYILDNKGKTVPV